MAKETKPQAAPAPAAAVETAAAPAKRGIVLPEGFPGAKPGETRAAYIQRRIFDEGATRSSVAKELGVKYQIVYAAIKPRLKKTGDFSPGKVQKAAPAAAAA